MEYGIKLKESGILLTIGIQNPSSTDKDWIQKKKKKKKLVCRSTGI